MALVAALAGINRCIFWFHPLAWRLERKLALLAELACDESCIATLGNREDYARLLLEMALVVDSSQGRLRQHALTMAAGSHMRHRIDSILKEGRAFLPQELSWTAWAAMALVGVPLVLCAGSITVREIGGSAAAAPTPALRLVGGPRLHLSAAAAPCQRAPSAHRRPGPARG